MKYFVALAVMASGMRIDRPFKIGTEVIDFDENDGVQEPESLTKMFADDGTVLAEMDKELASAERNVGMGSLNNAMSLALAQDVKQKILASDANVEKLLKAEDDQYPTIGMGLSMVQIANAKDKNARRKELSQRAHHIQKLIPRLTQLELKLQNISDLDEETDLPRVEQHMKKLKLL